LFKFFIDRKNKLFKFFIVGFSLAILNLVLMYLLVDILKFQGVLEKNLANAIVIEIGIILSFLLNKNWTWKNVTYNSQENIFFQLFKFHTVVGSTGVLRLILFAFFQLYNLNYLLNTLLCIIIASIFNFILYDLRVFNEKK
tara:strand:+ start:14096 stop:14518 length:423 start_codon:yes stop_codon:yes gene_type:complete